MTKPFSIAWAAKQISSKIYRELKLLLVQCPRCNAGHRINWIKWLPPHRLLCRQCLADCEPSDIELLQAQQQVNQLLSQVTNNIARLGDID